MSECGITALQERLNIILTITATAKYTQQCHHTIVKTVAETGYTSIVGHMFKINISADGKTQKGMNALNDSDDREVGGQLQLPMAKL